MANPVLGKDKLFQPGGYAGFNAPSTQPSGTPYSSQQTYPTQQAYGTQQPYSTQPAYGTPQTSAADLNAMYNKPAASNASMGRMTYEDVIMRTGSLFGVLLVAFAATWFAPAGIRSLLMIAGLVVGLVLGLVNSFKKEPSAPLILAYGAAQGLALGGISWVFEASYPGIVMQAVLATLSVFAAVLIGFRSGRLRTSPKLNKIFFIALIGYTIFSLVNLGMMVFGGMSGFGMRNGILGIAIGVFAVLLASYSLVMDFEFIKNGVDNGIPRNYAWRCAFGLIMTLVWMYMEILRILAILRGNN